MSARVETPLPRALLAALWAFAVALALLLLHAIYSHFVVRAIHRHVAATRAEVVRRNSAPP